MRLVIASLLALSSLAAVGGAQTRPAKTLDTYYIDVEGGLSALYVSPTGQSLLIDTGSPGGRDAGRILETLKMAGVKQIDHMLLTHYHGDHAGGLQEISQQIPIKHFYDHGPNSEPTDQVTGFRVMYDQLLAKAEHTVLKAGDKIPFAGTTTIVVTSAGQTLKTPIAGAPGAGQPNPACADFKPRDESRVDPDNQMSVGVVIAYRKFRTVNLGDFTYNRERDLMCPNNPIGTVDVYMTSHHGIDQSGSPALVHGLRPRVAIMNNSAGKGGAVPTMQTLFSSPGLEDVWQLHWAYAALLELNAPSLFIANVEDAQTTANAILNPPPTFGQGPPRAPGAGAPPPGAGRGRGGHDTGPWYMIKVSGNEDGSFTVTNTRNNFTKTYAALK